MRGHRRPGLSQVAFRRVGLPVVAPCGTVANARGRSPGGTSQTSAARMCFRRVGAQCCGSPGPNCTPGQVLYSGAFASEHEIASDAIILPPFGVYEIPGLPAFPACTNFRIAVTADLRWGGTVHPGPADASAFAYLNDSGMTLDDRSFTFAPSPPAPPGTGSATATLGTGTPADGVYHPETFAGQSSFFVNPYEDFVGPRAAQSLYFWVPVRFPSFATGIYFIKNVSISIVTV